MNKRDYEYLGSTHYFRRKPQGPNWGVVAIVLVVLWLLFG